MNTEDKNEFDNIKNAVFYLDWNIISYLSEIEKISDHDLKVKVMCFSQILINNVNKEYTVFPYSNAHLLDINQGKKSLIESKLKLLSFISKNWVIHEERNNKEKVSLNKKNNLFKEFEKYHTEQEEGREFSQKFYPVLNEIIKPGMDLAYDQINELPDDKIKTASIKLLDAVFPLNNPRAGLETMKFIKFFRNQKLSIDGRKFKFPGINKNIIEYERSELIRNIDEVLRKSSYELNSAEEFFNTIKNVPFLSDFTNEVIKICALSDLLGLTSEKMNKDISFQSMINDQIHISLGLRSHYFISEDINLLTKSRLIKKWLGLNVQIFDIDGFNLFLLRNIPVGGIDKNRRKVEYNFMDEDGNVIKTYSFDRDET